MTLVRLPGGTFFPYQVNTDQWILKNDGPTGPLSYLCYATKTSTKHGDQVWRSVCCETRALFTSRSSYICVMAIRVLGIPLALTHLLPFISRRLYKHARQLVPQDVRVFPSAIVSLAVHRGKSDRWDYHLPL